MFEAYVRGIRSACSCRVGHAHDAGLRLGKYRFGTVNGMRRSFRYMHTFKAYAMLA